MYTYVSAYICLHSLPPLILSILRLEMLILYTLELPFKVVNIRFDFDKSYLNI